MYRVQNDPELIKQAATVLPMMSFELKGLKVDPGRHKNTLNQITRKNIDPNKASYMYQSVPYDLYFELYIYCKNAEDGTKILEQIVHNFKPQWDMTLQLIPEMNIKVDTPVILGDVSLLDKYDGNFTERRAIVWTLTFTMKGEIWGPIKSKKIIKFAKQNFYFDANNMTEENRIGNITVTPGLTANGQPTTLSANSVDPNVIYADDDFGFVIESSGLILHE